MAGKRQDCFEVHIGFSLCFQISLEVPMNMLIFFWDEYAVVHFGNVAHHCYFSFSKP